MAEFRVSANWMRACGKGDSSATYQIKETNYNLAGCKGFDAFVILDTPQGDWTVAVARGEFI